MFRITMLPSSNLQCTCLYYISTWAELYIKIDYLCRCIGPEGIIVRPTALTDPQRRCGVDIVLMNVPFVILKKKQKKQGVHYMNSKLIPNIIFVCLVVFNVPSTARSFRDGTPIYCPLRRTWSSINTPFRPGIEPRAVAWQSITLPLRYASSTQI